MQSFRLCHVHWHILKTSSVCNRTSSTDCYTEHLVGSSTADTVINHYTEPIEASSTAHTVRLYYAEPIEASSTADTVRHCYTEHMVDRIYHIRLICFLIDTLHGNYRKLSVGVFLLFQMYICICSHTILLKRRLDSPSVYKKNLHPLL